MKNTLGFNSRLDEIEQISELKDAAMGLTQTEPQNEKKIKESEDTFLGAKSSRITL